MQTAPTSLNNARVSRILFFFLLPWGHMLTWSKSLLQDVTVDV
jgi:hypothetical protein